jgi:transcription elongation factor Elf1
MSYLESKYLNLLSSQLRNFKRKGANLWQFSCPYCGDSQKKKTKARGYVYNAKDVLLYHCHNCSLSTNVPKLIKHVSHTLYEEYVRELMAEKYQPKKDRAEEFAVQVKKPVTTWETDKLQKVSELTDTHPCKQYVVQRKLPTSWYARLFYVPKFMEWTNSLLPGKFGDKALKHDEGRLIIPLRTKDKNVFGYQGRSLKEELDNNEQRYYTIILDETQPKIFGMDLLDEKRKFYVFEGPIDSMFIQNSVAAAGGDLLQIVSRLAKETAVLVFDNEPRSKEVCKKIHRAILQDYQVCIWPTSVTEKDINEMIMNAMNTDFIKRIIDNSTFSGLSAQLAFHGWKKI